MRNLHSNAHQNVYKSIRLHAAKYDSSFSSMDSAAELLFIGRQTLVQIESGKTTPNAETARKMAEVYHAPELLSYYCSTECPLGKARQFKPTEGLRLEGAALHIISMLSKSEYYTRMLIEAAKDGVIDSQEVENAEAIIRWIDELGHLKDELFVSIKRRDIDR